MEGGRRAVDQHADTWRVAEGLLISTLTREGVRRARVCLTALAFPQDFGTSHLSGSSGLDCSCLGSDVIFSFQKFAI